MNINTYELLFIVRGLDATLRDIAQMASFKCRMRRGAAIQPLAHMAFGCSNLLQVFERVLGDRTCIAIGGADCTGVSAAPEPSAHYGILTNNSTIK